MGLPKEISAALISSSLRLLSPGHIQNFQTTQEICLESNCYWSKPLLIKTAPRPRPMKLWARVLYLRAALVVLCSLTSKLRVVNQKQIKSKPLEMLSFFAQEDDFSILLFKWGWLSRKCHRKPLSMGSEAWVPSVQSKASTENWVEELSNFHSHFTGQFNVCWTW